LAVCAVLLLANRQVSRAQQRAGGDEDLYRCHLDEDTACTVVRQTPQGVVVLSYRSAVAGDKPEGWSVVIGNGMVGSRAAPPGTVMIVPATPAVPMASSGARSSSPAPNGAPILE
jgi:hypothetical protein